MRVRGGEGREIIDVLDGEMERGGDGDYDSSSLNPERVSRPVALLGDSVGFS